MIESVTVVCGLAWGDEGKGKVTSALASTSNQFDMVCRWAGGNNAGHTIYKDGKKYKTHLIPSGVFYNLPSIIGPGCVVHWKSFMEEVFYIKENGFDHNLIKISPRAHIVTDEHIDKDKRDLSEKLGTTSKGIAPCYAAKAARIGKLAKDLPIIEQLGFLWDENLSGNILCEGAQGFWLDMDMGNYPYVTSSTTLPYAACSLGFPPQKIKKIVGVSKIYDTRSGEDPDFPDSLFENPELALIAKEGKEFGVTTGRPRKVNYLNLDKLIDAVKISGTTHLIVNKVDILENVNVFKLIYQNKLVSFKNINEMKTFLNKKLITETSGLLQKIIFSSNPEKI